MDANGWKPAGQGEAPAGGVADAPAAAEWKAQFPHESRQKVIGQIMETLKKRFPSLGIDGVNRLQKIAVLIEETSFTAATSLLDYKQKLSRKVFQLKPKPEPTAPKNPSMPNTTVAKQSLANPESLGSQGHSSTMPMINQPSMQQALAQSLQHNSSSAVQSSANLPSALSSITSHSQSTETTVVHTSNLHSISDKSQNSTSNSVGGPPLDIYDNAQRQVQGRQLHQQVISEQRQLQNQLIYQKIQHPSHLQPHMPHHQQPQSLLQPTQLQSSQQSVMQTSSSLQSDQSNIQPTVSVLQPGLQQNQLNSVQQSVPCLLQQHSQSMAGQQQQAQPSVHHQMTSLQRQPTSVTHQSSLPQTQEQQHLMCQQENISKTQQAEQLWQQNIVQDGQKPQQIGNQQSVSLYHHHQLGPQSNISGLQQQQQLQQQQLPGSLPSFSNPKAHQSLMHVQQQVKITGQEEPQTQLTSLELLQPQSQQSQHQLSQQQHITQFQSQPGQLQQQLPIQQQSNSLQREMQQKLPASATMDSITQTGHDGVVDWQDTYQKLNSIKEKYFADLNALHQEIALRLQQHDALTPPAEPSEYYEKLKRFKSRIEHMLKILQLPKSNMQPALKDILPLLEEQIVTILASYRGKKAPSSHTDGQQQFQRPGGHGHSVAQQQPSQVSRLQQHSNHAGNVQQINLQDLTATSAPQSSENRLQPTVSPTRTSSDAPQQHHLKKLQQEQHQQGMQTQKMGQQLQQCHLQPQLSQQQQNQQLLQPQELLQLQLQQLQKKQQTRQMPLHQKPLLHHKSENECKGSQGSSIKQGLYQQQCSVGQPHNYYHKQGKSGFSSSLSLQQNQQTLSPQVPDHSSPQIDQRSLVYSQLESGTPLQSASLPVVPSPSTPLAPSPVQGDSEKQLSGISSLTNDSYTGHQEAVAAPPQVQPFMVSTPGISASPLLEFANQDGDQANVPAAVPNNRSPTKRPIEHLIKVVLSSTPEDLRSSISDMGSIVSMFDMISSSAPGNGSRAAVGEDLAAMTKCHLQARSVMSQDGTAATKRMKCNINAMPLNYVFSADSVTDCFKQSYGLNTSELESTATSQIKRHNIEVRHELMEEIREINQKLIDTVVSISEEDADLNAAASESRGGTVIKCCFTAVTLSPSLSSQFTSAQMCPILPLRLLVPANYPKFSPVLLDPLPDQPRESDDLSIKAKSMFSISLRSLSQPSSLGEMARTWDACARKVIAEYAQQTGGGSFSSRYGFWENCVGA